MPSVIILHDAYLLQELVMMRPTTRAREVGRGRGGLNEASFVEEEREREGDKDGGAGGH